MKHNEATSTEEVLVPFRVETETCSISKHLRQVFSIIVWLTGVVQGFFDGHPFVRSVLRHPHWLR